MVREGRKMSTLVKRNNNRIKGCLSDKIFDIINTILLTFLLIVIAYPLLIVLSSSISGSQALFSGKVWLYPVDITFGGFERIVTNNQVLTGIGNSVFYTVVGTSINMVVSICAAYPLSRKDLRIRGFINRMFAFTMLFSGGLIPSYILVRNLGMYNTRWALLIPCAMSVWNMILIRTYFQASIPESLFESARLDGCDDFRYLLYIAIPVSLPVIAVVTLYYTVAHWNTFFSAYLYLQKASLKPLQVVLRDILLMSQMENLAPTVNSEAEAQMAQLSETLKYSLVVVSSIPMTVLYLFTQKYFTKGIMVGSVKG